MIKNFFRITFRNIARNKGAAFINVSGLAIGLAASLLILLWVQNELSYEKNNLKAENIYRVEQDQNYSGQLYHVTVTPQPSGPVWMEKIPEIIEQTRINRMPRILFRQGENVFFETGVIAADSGLFRMFTLPFVLGDPETALNAPHNIVLSEKLAKKYFGSINVIGQTLTLENSAQFTVSGVIKDLPNNAHYKYEAVLPYSFLSEIGVYSDSWGNNSILTFVELVNGANIEEVNNKLTEVVKENNPNMVTTFNLFPLLDIHLRSQFGFTQNKGPVIAVTIFTLIAIFILLIACINFINLSTAKAATRGKEIGIKKVVGADKLSMATQFMFESILMVAFALLLALLLIGLSLSLFNDVSGKSFTLADLLQLKFILSFIAVGLLAGLISGVYPAFYLSSFKPVVVLKGESAAGKGSIRFRQILVIIQFTLSILIATATIFMYLQLKFVQKKELGYDKENLICINMTDNIREKYFSLKNELVKETMVQGVTASSSNPVNIGSNSGGASWDGKDPENQVLIGINAVDYDYLETMKIELVSGRTFSKEFPSDLAKDTLGGFMVNEEVVKFMEVDDPIGKNFSFVGVNGTIVGVMKNFHFSGGDQLIEPMAFILTDGLWLNNILIRLTPGDIPASLKTVEKIWNKVLPEYPFEYSFVDQDYDNLYRSQIRLTTLLKYFTFLTIIIACLGLYGLSAYSAQRRTKEVGIRKVMGAGSLMVMYSLSKEFLLLVLISIVIAVPIGWILVEKLLKQFAYRIDISVYVFAIIALGALAIALLTVSFQAYRATGINPSESLKDE